VLWWQDGDGGLNAPEFTQVFFCDPQGVTMLLPQSSGWGKHDEEETPCHLIVGVPVHAMYAHCASCAALGHLNPIMALA